MSTVPQEFDPSFIAQQSSPDRQIYRAETRSKEPMASLLANNPEIYFVPPQRRSEWGNWEFKPGSYYDTTIGSKHAFWRDHDLPKPSKDIDRLRNDLLRWGYCKVEDALSADQIKIMRQRVLEQAEGERLAGIAQRTPSGQNINCCVNKGRCFELFVEQHPEIAQGTPPSRDIAAISDVQIQPGPSASVTNCSTSGPPWAISGCCSTNNSKHRPLFTQQLMF